MKILFLSILLIPFSVFSQLIFFQKDLLWGAMDKSGKIIHEPRFETWEKVFNNETCYIISENGKSGLADSTGKILIKPVFEELAWLGWWMDGYLRFGENIDFSEDHLHLSDSAKFGVTDRSGKIILPAKYRDVNIRSGAILVGEGGTKTKSGHYNNGTFGAFDLYGRQVVPVKYKQIYIYDEIITARVSTYFNEKGPHPHYYNIEGDSLITEYPQLIHLGGKYFRVFNGKKWAVMDFSGKMYSGFEFSQVWNEIQGTKVMVLTDKKGKWAVYDILSKKTEGFGSQNEVYFNYGFDKKKEKSKTNDEIRKGADGKKSYYRNYKLLFEGKFDTLLKMQQGTAVGIKDGNVWMMDSTGKEILVKDLDAKRVKEFYNGYAPFSRGGEKDRFGRIKNERWGFISSDGKIIEPRFLEVKEWGREGVAVRPDSKDPGRFSGWIFLNRDLDLVGPVSDDVAY